MSNRATDSASAATKCLPGRQSYFVDVLGTPNAGALSVVSCRIVERMGEPWCIQIELTHPESLSRKDYLGKDATFTLAPAGAEPRPFHGCITKFSQLKRTRDFCSYRFVIEAHVARLRLTHASRIFQQRSAPQIIEAILRRHGFRGHQFVFKTRRAYPEHAFRLQYQISDWDYIRVLMEQEGLYCYFVPGEHGDVLVFGDDIDHYLYQPTLTLPYREPAGLESENEAILSLETHTQTVPQSFLVADYNPQAAWERFKADANVASKDTTTYGQPYVYGTGHLDQRQAKWEAQLRHEAAICEQVCYLGESSYPGMRCARIVNTDEDMPDAPNGMAIIEVIHTGARDNGYRNSFKAIPADRRFRLPLNDASWPRIKGTLSARVTSPSQYKYAYLTQAGYYVVRFDLDFDKWNPGGESVPLRLAKPFAGKLQTGMHFPALDGDEAVIEFRDGDPNKPYIAAFHHHSQATDLITNQDRWMSRNVIRTPADNTLRMEDWRGEEHVKLSTEHSGKSQLTLGHIVDRQRQKRGEGFELRTSAYGAIRSGRGLVLSTHDRPHVKGTQLDIQEAFAQLHASRDQMAALAERAAAADARAADVEAMNRVLEDELKEIKQAVMVLTANASIAVASPKTIVHSAGENLVFASGQHTDVNAMGHVTVASSEHIGLFAQQGIQQIANQGAVTMQAQNDAMALLALKDLRIDSIDGTLTLTAKKEVRIGAGGSYVLIDGNGIQNVTPGDITEKCTTWKKSGAASETIAATAPPPGSAVACATQAASANAGHAALMGGDG